MFPITKLAHTSTCSGGYVHGNQSDHGVRANDETGHCVTNSFESDRLTDCVITHKLTIVGTLTLSYENSSTNE